MALAQTTLPPLDAWEVQSVRLTAFCPIDTRINPSEWWTNVVGYPPESVTSRPKAGQHLEEGIFEGRKLSLQVQLERIDWYLSAIGEPREDVFEIPTSGSWPDVSSLFVKLMLRWLPACPPIVRLAFGAVLFQPAQDRKAGYIQLAKYLPNIKLDPESSSDFFYQINRPRDSALGIKGLRLNRLSKWSVTLFGHFAVDLGRTQLTTKGYIASESACRLELDINTLPEFSGELLHEALPKLFQELITLGEEIAAKGDIP